MTVGSYIPPHFRQDDPEFLAETVARHPFAAVTLCDGEGQMLAVHLPFLRFGDPRDPAGWRFESHLARANPVAEALAGGAEAAAILIFTGPDAYVNPRWYVDARDTSVPTWNYQAVHVRGTVRLAGEGEPGWLDRHLHDLIDTHQARIGADPFDWAHLPETQIERMQAAIVGIELLPERIEGIEKLGQNKSVADRDGVIDGLRRRDDAECDAMADLMRSRET
ncbi:FMN-binding negative transcriptional regulator [Guyparkeria sp.]|uniref:FMN-binding negative transcriptional regulator n=1 Tax=Guyparkeria sp. TaxID=2035736 RepID=UPI00356274CF